MGDCPSPSSRSWWMEGECQSLMCLMAWRDIDIDILYLPSGFQARYITDRENGHDGPSKHRY